MFCMGNHHLCIGCGNTMINYGSKNLPSTFVCLVSGIKLGGATASRVGGSCNPLGAEMAQQGRKIVTLH